MTIFHFSRILKYRYVKGSQIKASIIVSHLLNVLHYIRLFKAMIRVLMKSHVSKRVWRNKRNVLRQTVESHCAVRMTGFPKKSIWKFAASKAASKNEWDACFQFLFALQKLAVDDSRRQRVCAMRSLLFIQVLVWSELTSWVYTHHCHHWLYHII